ALLAFLSELRTKTSSGSPRIGTAAWRCASAGSSPPILCSMSAAVWLGPTFKLHRSVPILRPQTCQTVPPATTFQGHLDLRSSSSRPQPLAGPAGLALRLDSGPIGSPEDSIACPGSTRMPLPLRPREPAPAALLPPAA